MFKKIMLSLVVLGMLMGCATMKPADQVAVEEVFVLSISMVFDNNPQLKAPMTQIAQSGMDFLNGNALATGVTRATVVNFITTQVSAKMDPAGTNPHLAKMLSILVNDYLPQWSSDTSTLINAKDKALLLQIAGDVLEAAK
jgi:hypothetical protein